MPAVGAALRPWALPTVLTIRGALQPASGPRAEFPEEAREEGPPSREREGLPPPAPARSPHPPSGKGLGFHEDFSRDHQWQSGISLLSFFFSFSFFFFLAAPQHMEFPGQGSDLSNPSPQLQQLWILNPLCQAGDQTCVQCSQDAANPSAPQQELPQFFSLFYFFFCKLLSPNCTDFFFFFFLLFVGPLPRHMEVPRLGVESEP